MTAQELLVYTHEPYRQELPNDRRSEVEGKAPDWLAAGTRAVVAVDPPLRTATVYRARDDIRILTEDERPDLADVVAGWSARVGDLFA